MYFMLGITLIKEIRSWENNPNLKRFYKKYHYLYKVTNIINGEYYIGRHSTDNLKDGYMGSGTRLRRSFKKYGKSNFIKEILYYSRTFTELVLLEESYINSELLGDNKCLNLTVGGMSPILFGEDNGNYGNTLSYEQKKAISDKAKLRVGDKNPFFGKKHKKSSREKMSKASSMQTGENNGFFGKKHTEEYKLKSSVRTKERYKNNPELIENLRKIKLKAYYITPEGTFETAIEASRSVGCAKSTIFTWCKRSNNRITGTGYNIPEKYRSTTKTWSDFGFGYRLRDD